ncbi:MAG: SMI1/KNR4 family protein [Anaerolineales bacterium]|nr:SMI1/KNR4 family protein [Anaerolineales bacterium]
MPKKVSISWNQITAWFASYAPITLDGIRPPASLAQLDAAATALHVQFPDDLRQLYQITDGMEPASASSGIFPAGDEWDMAFSLLPVEQIVSAWEMQRELLEIGDFTGLEAEASEGVANDWWNIKWVPFASNGSGDYYCIDLAPTTTGTVGQVIGYSHESGERNKLANSLAEYLNRLADLLEANRLWYDQQYGIRRKTAETERQAARIDEKKLKDACQKAENAFRNKDYAAVVDLLDSFETALDKVAAAKLAFARKKLQ